MRVTLDGIEVAAMGRIPHKGSFDRETATDRHIVAEALTEVGMAQFAHRRYSTLSGGERQRVLIARALVQGSPVLVLDEPTNHLDIRYQLDVLHRVRRLGLTTLAALHDLNLAAAWCDHVYSHAPGPDGRWRPTGAGPRSITDQQRIRGARSQLPPPDHRPTPAAVRPIRSPAR